MACRERCVSHLVPAGERQDVVLHRVGRQHGQFGLLVRLDVLRLFSQLVRDNPPRKC